jgi:hypothetical protein
VFGDLQNNWVHSDPNGALVSSSGAHYSQCPAVIANTGCDPKLHQNAQTAKVGGYSEPSWFSGGSRPVLFPHFALPEIGVRFKPADRFVGRVVVGFSITGFFFGLGGSYELSPHGAVTHTKSEPAKGESKEPGKPSKEEEKAGDVDETK